MSPEINHIDAAIADLEAWKERISAAIEMLKMLGSGGGALPGVASSAGGTRPASSGEIQHDTFFQMSVPDAAEKYLTMAKKTKSTSEVAESLLKGGLKSAAKKFPAMVNTILTRESRFVRVNREWGLDAWYPGMRKTAGRKHSGGDGGVVDEGPAKTNTAQPKPPQVKHDGFTMDSLRGRTLTLINSEPTIAFNAPTIAQRLQVDNVGSVSAALSALFSSNLIRRGRKGWYQAK